MLQLGGMLSKLMHLKCIMNGDLGAKSPVAEQFSQSLEKNNQFNITWITFCTFFKAVGKNKVAEIGNLPKILKLPSSFSFL